MEATLPTRSPLEAADCKISAVDRLEKRLNWWLGNKGEWHIMLTTFIFCTFLLQVEPLDELLSALDAKDIEARIEAARKLAKAPIVDLVRAKTRLEQHFKNQQNDVKSLLGVALIRIDPKNITAAKFVAENLDSYPESFATFAAEALLETPERGKTAPFFKKRVENFKIGTGNIGEFKFSIFALYTLGPLSKEALPALSGKLQEFDSDNIEPGATMVAGVILKIDGRDKRARAHLIKHLSEVESFLPGNFAKFSLEVMGMLGRDAKSSASKIEKFIGRTKDIELKKLAEQTLERISE